MFSKLPLCLGPPLQGYSSWSQGPVGEHTGGKQTQPACPHHHPLNARLQHSSASLLPFRINHKGWRTSQADLALLHFTDNCAFYKPKVCGNPVLSKSMGAFVSKSSICSLPVSVTFGNSHNISDFFVIILFIMVICDQWS